MARSSNRLALSAFSPLAFLFLTSCGWITYDQDHYTLENICRRLPSDLCDVRASGCKTSGVGFDKDVCEARELASCQASTEAVLQGDLAFHPEEVSTCLALLLLASDRTETGLQASLIAQAPCARIFQGKLGPMDECERDSQCRQPAQRDQIARCERDQRCEVVRVLNEGESCEVDNDGNHRCDSDLVCHLPVTPGSPDIGICVRQIALDASCSPFVDAESCGREGTCNKTTLTCEPRQPMGSRCYSNRDCLSGHCADERCGPDTTLFTGWACGQPCTGSLCDGD